MSEVPLLSLRALRLTSQRTATGQGQRRIATPLAGADRRLAEQEGGNLGMKTVRSIRRCVIRGS